MKLRNILLILGLFSLITTSCKKEDNNNPPDKPFPDKGDYYTCEVIRPTLKWSCSDPEGDEISYTLKFGTSAESMEVIASNLTVNEFTFNQNLNASTRYYWQIIASDKKKKTTGDVWEFSTVSNPVVNTVPSTPIIISPKENTKAGNITFIWSVVVDDGGLQNITYILNVNGLEYELKESTMKSITLPAGLCKWFVTAYDKDGNGSESERVTISLGN